MSGSIDTQFLKLINENMGIAYKVCRIYFNGSEDQEDVLQEMMYQLWRSFDRFDRRSKFSTWMYSVCLNTALTYKRKTRNNPAISMDTEHEQIATHSENDKEEAIGELYKAIDTLTPVNKAIMMLYLEELSYEEIAEITGLTKSNVSVRLVRAKKELQQLMRNINN
ncbi:MAG TPA: sigma-70 family RNA polymerase sigma factor [Cyclobacteriaceae bacterium]|nr:sigma-70 family RNA polymerase sigma factor [Cyclobacteriaceae bacterium]